jgi:hypothetical protein
MRVCGRTLAEASVCISATRHSSDEQEHTEIFFNDKFYSLLFGNLSESLGIALEFHGARTVVFRWWRQRKEGIMHIEEVEDEEHRSLIPRSDKKALFILLLSSAFS